MAKKKYKTLIMIFTSEMICEGAVSAKWARDPFTPCQPEVIPLPFFANTNRHGLVAWQNFLSCAGFYFFPRSIHRWLGGRILSPHDVLCC